MVLARLFGQPVDTFATGSIACIDPRLRLGPDRNADPTGRFVLLRWTLQVLCSERRLALHAPGVFWKPFLQSFRLPVFGSNGPLWSLSYEFWYYILFPVLMIAAASWAEVRSRLLYLGLALVLFWFVGTQISLYFLIWVMGVLIGRVRRLSWPRFPRAMALASVVAGLPLAVVLAWTRVHPGASETMTDFTIGLCFSLWIYVLLQISREDVSQPYAKPAKILAGFSYTLYLTHFPVLLLLRGVLDPGGNWQPDRWHLICALAIALLMLGYAYLVAEFTEARTGAVRRRLLQPWAPQSREVVR